MIFLPSVIETTGRSSKAFDLPTKLLQDRIIYLGGEINADSANIIIMQLLWLNADDPNKDINLYINSPGGSIYDGLGIIDIMNLLDAKVNTLCVGLAASMGAVLLAAGTGLRKSTQNARIMIHSVSNRIEAKYHDLEIEYEESKFLQKKMLLNFVDYSKGKLSLKEIEKMSERDYYMDPLKAQSFGLIDCIV
jgi:ATP-dependent Clp protease protease subunit